MVDKGVQICIKDTSRRKKLGGLFGNSDLVKVLLIPDLSTKQVIINTVIPIPIINLFKFFIIKSYLFFSFFAAAVRQNARTTPTI